MVVLVCWVGVVGYCGYVGDEVWNWVVYYYVGGGFVVIVD